MNYLEARSKVKTGDLITLTHRSWKTWYDFQIQMVRLFDQSEYCHVGMIVWIGDTVFVVESVTPTVRLVPLSNFVEEGFYWIPLGGLSSTEEVNAALSMVGKARYSKWDAVKGWFKKLRIGSNRSWQCAEAVIFWRRISGINLGNVATPSAVVEAALTLHDTSVHIVKGK